MKTSFDKLIIRDIKEKFGYIAQDFEMELSCSSPDLNNKKYALPDGNIIQIGNHNERMVCCEALFKPSLFASVKQLSSIKKYSKLNDLMTKYDGIDNMIYHSINSINNNSSLQSEMWANIILSGNSSMFAGIKDRMRNELFKKKNSPIKKDKIQVFSSLKYQTWIGGSIFGQCTKTAIDLDGTTDNNYTIMKNDYDEYGPAVVNTICNFCITA